MQLNIDFSLLKVSRIDSYNGPSVSMQCTINTVFVDVCLILIKLFDGFSKFCPLTYINPSIVINRKYANFFTNIHSVFN